MGTSVAELEITNMMGIHLRPASNLVQMANQYPDCEVTYTKDGQTVNGKSIMSVIMLAAEKGCKIKVEVTGDDSDNLLKEIVALVEDKFGED